MFRRSLQTELETARRALAQGRYEVAFERLEAAVGRARPGRPRAGVLVELAAFYALYGSDGVEDGRIELEAALGEAPEIAESPLFRALEWEFAALGGASAREVKRGVRELRDAPDAVARYHAASALLAAGAARSALAALAEIDEAALPAHLRWRRRSLEGLAHEQLGHYPAAATAYAEAVAGSDGPDRDGERLNLASCQLELDRYEEVLELLAEVDPSRLADPLERADHAYLGARAQRALGNPNRALELLDEAIELQRQADESPADALLARGQLLVDVERYDEAVAALEEAAAVADEGLRGQALHELAVALAETEELERAREVYREIAADEAYAFRADALADGADLLLRLGELDEAREAAEKALEEGGPPTACLTLGSIAFEYFRLDEAVTWFERAASASEPGDPTWVQAQQLLADVFAQQLPQQAERLLKHARAALEHTGTHSDWFLPLQQYVEVAQAHLGGSDRVLN